MEARARQEIAIHRASARERLERLAALMESLESADFDLGVWASCAVGHAAHNPWFRAQGLEPGPRGPEIEGRALEGAEGFGPVARFFGISYSDALKLFSGDTSPLRMGRRLRRFLAGLGA